MYTPLITDGSKKFGNNRWYTYSDKLKRPIFLFSDLEYEHWLLIETNPLIIDFCEQPKLMKTVLNGTIHTSITDMWVKFVDGTEKFIEVKYSKDLQKLQVKKQISTQKQWCIENGFQHEIATEIIIRNNPILLSNLKFLIKLLKQYEFDNEIISFQIIKLLSESPMKKIKIQQIVDYTNIVQNHILIVIGQLIFKNKILSNIDKQTFGFNSEVWIDAK